MKTSEVALIPVPKECEMTEGKLIRILAEISIENEAFSGIDETFRRCAEKIHGLVFKTGNVGIRFVFNASLSKGQYILEASCGSVLVQASSASGAGYAAASLLQIIRADNGDIFVPEIRIKDHPDKEYRGFMVDLARKWHPFRTLLSYVDLCFLYKINYIQLHFTDDQSCTLPFRSFPEMATKGRSYTPDEIAQLCEYADKAAITLIPEIEAPGHATHIVERYPEFFANRIKKEDVDSFENELGVKGERKEGIICAGSEIALDALDKMIEEVCELFPHSPYIHIGGDEALISQWDKCSVCREYMHNRQIKSIKDLYADFVGHLSNLVLKRGRTPIVWEGFPKEGAWRISKETIVIAWESYYNMPYDLLEAGFKVINASWQPLYVVPESRHRWNAFDILKWNVYNWQHWWPKSEANLNPIHVAPTDSVIGTQLCAWECTFEQEAPFVVENLAAMSERAWSVRRICSDDEYYKKQRRITSLATSLLC